MKKNYLRAVLSFAVAGMMALSMIGTGNGSIVNAEDTDWEYSKSKTTASDVLDANYETQITLSLPSKQEQLKSDVLFVMDVSSCAAGADTVINNLMNQLSEQIKESNASVRVGLVVFKGTAVKAFDLADYSEENKTKLLQLAGKITAASVKYENQDEDIHKEGKDELKALLPGMGISGSNIPSGLLCAKSMLEENDGVDNARKHMILISDGATYLYCGKNTSGVLDYNTHLTRLISQSEDKKENVTGGALQEWTNEHPVNVNGTKDINQIYGDWTPTTSKDQTEYLAVWKKYLDNKKSSDETNNLSQYDQDYYKDIDYNNMEPLIVAGSKENAVCNVEKSMIQARDIFEEIQREGYHCNAYTTGDEVANIFTGFMNYLAGGNAEDITKGDLKTISNDIFYFLGAGSQIEDEMGENSTYNFNFVNDAASLKLTVGNVVYTATKATNLTNKGETAKYLFTSAGVTAKKATGAATEPEAPYVLHYYDGSDGTSERIVWEINENVSDFARVQLTYSEKLMNPQTVADTYTVATNNSATLYPVDSNGNSKTPETFTSPVVKYTVLPKTDNKPSAAPVPTTNPTDNRPTTPTADDRNERPNTPNTGDQTNAPLAAGVLAVALLTCGAVFFFKKKYSN